MVKFNFLFHKETGTIIKYEEWLEKYKIDMWSFFTDKSENKQFSYKPKDMLFSNDFIIVYDSEFTTKELIELTEEIGLDLETKINELIGEREYLKDKYNVDL